MTPHEKAVSAINTRLERLQANLREAKVETVQGFLLQSIMVTIGVAEALNDYIKRVGTYAQRRHGEVKQANEAVAAQHAGLLEVGKELLEKLKANPTDQALRHEIKHTQQQMAALQKTVRREANALQRELAPCVAVIDQMAVSVKRFGEADQADALKRQLKTVVGEVREFYAAHPTPAAKRAIDAAAWEKAACTEIEQATDFYDAYARTGYHTILALELMTTALSENPPQSAEEFSQRANDAVAKRIKEVTGRFATT